jgi:hypothetical protein
MDPSIFNFAMGTKIYPKESRIARAKAAAVGGKRKRCKKGKNCSAACIAANMVCLVDLPWVGSALTKAAAQIQAAKGKAPAAAKPAPAAQPAATPKPAPAPAQQKPTWQKEQAVKNVPGTPAEQEKQLKFNLKVAKNKGTPEQIAEAQKQLKDFQDKQKAAAPKPAAATPKKKAIDKIPTVEVYKKWGVAQLEAGIENLKNSPNVNLESPTAKKAIGNMTEALKQLKAEQAAAAKPAAAPASAAAKPKTPVKVETVEKYKSFGLPFLENALPIAEKGRKAQTPEGQQAIANIKKAISELKAQPAKAAPAAVPAAPTAKPAAQGAAQLPVKAGSKALDPNKYDSGNFGQFHKDAQSMGLTKKETDDFLNKWLKDNSMYGLKSSDMPAFIKDFNKAAGLQTVASSGFPLPAAFKASIAKGSRPLDDSKYNVNAGGLGQFYKDAQKLGLLNMDAQAILDSWKKQKGISLMTNADMPSFIRDFNKVMGLSASSQKAANTTAPTGSPAAQAFQNLKAKQTAQAAAGRPTPLVKSATGNMPQPASPSNPHGLSLNQQAIWKKAFEAITPQWYKDYANTVVMSENHHKLQNEGDKARIARLLRAAQKNKFTEGLKKFYDQVKVTDKSSHLTDEQLAKMPSSIRNLVQEFGQSKLKRMLVAVRDFTGNDYGLIRNAMRGRPPERGDEKILTPGELQKKIDKYKKKGELIQDFLMASQNRPAVPKFRGVPMDKTKLDQMIALSQNGGSFQEAAMNSWSVKPDTAQSFSSPKGGASNRVIFRTVNKLGSSVKTLSSHQHEDELLTPANARYKVVGYTKEDVSSYGKPNTIHFFDVVEY